MDENRLLSILSDFKNGHTDISKTADLIQTQSSPGWPDVRGYIEKEILKIERSHKKKMSVTVYQGIRRMTLEEILKLLPAPPGTDKG
jgi:hypothetical protein